MLSIAHFLYCFLTWTTLMYAHRTSSQESRIIISTLSTIACSFVIVMGDLATALNYRLSLDLLNMLPSPIVSLDSSLVITELQCDSTTDNIHLIFFELRFAVKPFSKKTAASYKNLSNSY